MLQAFKFHDSEKLSTLKLSLITVVEAHFASNTTLIP